MRISKSLIASLIVLAGCAGYTGEYSDSDLAALENWRLCESIYRAANKPTLHIDHSHGRRNKTRPEWARSDLHYNQCRNIMRGIWVHP